MESISRNLITITHKSDVDKFFATVDAQIAGAELAPASQPTAPSQSAAEPTYDDEADDPNEDNVALYNCLGDEGLSRRFRQQNAVNLFALQKTTVPTTTIPTFAQSPLDGGTPAQETLYSAYTQGLTTANSPYTQPPAPIDPAVMRLFTSFLALQSQSSTALPSAIMAPQIISKKRKVAPDDLLYAKKNTMPAITSNQLS